MESAGGQSRSVACSWGECLAMSLTRWGKIRILKLGELEHLARQLQMAFIAAGVWIAPLGALVIMETKNFKPKAE